MWISWMIWLGALSFAQPEDAAPETWHLNVGETRLLEASSETDAEVSKRGPIQLERLDEASWRVTAMAKGFVMVTLRQDGEVYRRLHVHVSTLGEKDTTPPFCSRGIACADGLSAVSGETASLEDWL